MPDISIPWGTDSLTVSLPDQWTVQQTAEATTWPAEKNWPDRLGLALTAPATGTSLPDLLAGRRGGKVVIILEDMTRHSPLAEILRIVMREIEHAGVGRDDLELLFASGMHPPMTPREVAEKIGPAMTKIRWRCNPWHDPKAYESIGRVGRRDVRIDRGLLEAELRIIISSVSVHLQAGFGGGYKMIVPGCAALETIRSLHRLGLRDAQHQLVGSGPAGNPMRRAIDGAGKLLEAREGANFAVQYLLDSDNMPSFIAAGEVIPTQRMLAKQCSVATGVLIDNPADVLIANAYPRDHDLWQSFKCIANTRWACRPDGVIICLTRCEAAMQGMRVPRWPISPAWMRRIMQWLGADAVGSLITRLVPQLAGDAAFFVRMASQTLQRNPLVMVSPILHAAGGKFPGLEVVGSMAEAMAYAQRLLGDGPQRVTVFPAGGTTYPIPPSQKPTRSRGPGGDVNGGGYETAAEPRDIPSPASRP